MGRHRKLRMMQNIGWHEKISDETAGKLCREKRMLRKF